ncbi:MAG: glycosyltransferase family 1 protein [Candidatus Shapirobacteria bacterium]|nr:glycosyltransferase family 1 protein [Candidatus Shapirobacteria bacterium]
MIKIAINISPIFNGNSIRGVGYYTINLIDALKKEIKNNSDYKNWSIRLVKKSSIFKTGKYDLIHYPFFDPFNLTLSINRYTPTVVTVHDLIPREFKKHFPVGVKGNLKWLIQKHQLQKVSKIITVSNYSRDIINEITKYPLDKIFTTYLAADKSFKKIIDPKKLKEIRSKYNLPPKFVLFVGDINWNKNIPNLVKACLKLKYPLVIVGSAVTKKDVPKHPWTKDLLWLQSKYQENKETNNLIFTGFVPDEDLPLIYNLATIYCQPSFAEGFGLPLIQAMQSGCPVAYSQTTCLPEIMANNGLSFDPNSIEEIRNTLKKYWENQNIRQKYSQLGLEYVKNFNWSSTAQQTLAVYKLALLNGK